MFSKEHELTNFSTPSATDLSLSVWAIANIDGLVKSLKYQYFVIPTKAGIQSFQCVAKPLDSRFHGNDDFFARPLILSLQWLRHH